MEKVQATERGYAIEASALYSCSNGGRSHMAVALDIRKYLGLRSKLKTLYLHMESDDHADS